jgi:hypothetical protein
LKASTHRGEHLKGERNYTKVSDTRRTKNKEGNGQQQKVGSNELNDK